MTNGSEYSSAKTRQESSTGASLSDGRALRRCHRGVGIVDVADGLWLWRVDHPNWEPGADWAPPVTSTCIE
jgi:hypothetical protein